MYVRLSVSLRVLKTADQISPNVLYMLAAAQSSSDCNAIHYVLPVLWMK